MNRPDSDFLFDPLATMFVLGVYEGPSQFGAENNVPQVLLVLVRLSGLSFKL